MLTQVAAFPTVVNDVIAFSVRWRALPRYGPAMPAMIDKPTAEWCGPKQTMTTALGDEAESPSSGMSDCASLRRDMGRTWLLFHCHPSAVAEKAVL